jgi:hypothetical protein
MPDKDLHMTLDRDRDRVNRASPEWRRAPKRSAAIVIVATAALVAGALAVGTGRATSHDRAPIARIRSLAIEGRPPAPKTCGAGRLALPAARLVGYVLSYCTRFPGSSLPKGWDLFSGVPGGDPTGRFVPSHVTVHGGVLTLTASRDPKLHGRWGTGGVCQCGKPHTYGAYFVRSRVTGAGPDEIDLLWPVAHVWPPEIDFNESVSHANSTTWSVHFGRSNHVVHGVRRINLERWHTWGVIWTPRSVRLVVDGRTWGVVTAGKDIPRQPMTLDISQQTACGLSAECPTRIVRMEVDLVAEYTAT